MKNHSKNNCEKFIYLNNIPEVILVHIIKKVSVNK